LRALALLSGGLDSTLAIKIILDQGIEVEALNFKSVFCTCTPKTRSCSAAATAAQQLGVKLYALSSTSEFLEIVKKPKHGYGRNMNPCLDCRILMFRKAHERMKETGGSFLITGEVLGQRPMSQRLNAMRLIDEEAGVTGLVVRPLSAGVLEPSIPELKGWVDRNKLLSIEGRSRKPQIELAESFSINDYPCPAGGCRLTDPGFAARMKDLIEHEPELLLSDVKLLTVGRHFRISPTAKAVVGRNEEENEKLSTLRQDKDRRMEVVGLPGPTTIVRGQVSNEDLLLAAAITARYSKGVDLPQVTVAVWNGNAAEASELCVAPADTASLDATRVCRK